MYKISNGLSMPLMKDLFLINRNPYNLRQSSQFSRPRINTRYHGTESISSLEPVIWDLVPSSLKDINDLDKFIKAVKQWKPEDCPCSLCKFFVQNVGFLEKITWKKESLKLLKANWTIKRLFVQCVVFYAVKRCVGFVKSER